MNQVMSHERLEYFGYIFEEAGLLKDTAHSPGRQRKAKPGVVFGTRARPHEEVAAIEDRLKHQYKISPTKIRKAGMEELDNLL
jgi:hypothetical protein